jgi:hypothetical protein
MPTDTQKVTLSEAEWRTVTSALRASYEVLQTMTAVLRRRGLLDANASFDAALADILPVLRGTEADLS